MSASASKIYGIAAEFPSATALYNAAEKIRDKGFSRWDVFSPFPIHGMNDAMGIGKSWVSAISFSGGVLGLLTGFSLETWANVISYPTIVQGKPTSLYAIPAYFPVMFELTILLTAFATVFGMLAMNKLPRLHHPLFTWDRFARATDDAFFVAIESSDPKFSERDTQKFLESIGGQHITIVRDDD